MNVENVQRLVLRAPDGPAVVHLVLRIPEGLGRAAACLLHKLEPCFGPRYPSHPCLSIGFSFAGLEALGLPEAYLRLFRRLAPAFRDGAVQRSALLGDHGLSAVEHWHPAFGEDRAHALLSWHGPRQWAIEQADEFTRVWQDSIDLPADSFKGERLGHPDKESGEWVHFGYRDGISEVCIDHEQPRPAAPDCRDHKPGALILGEVNDAGSNRFVLNRAPDKVRTFFGASSFGIFRPMAQDVAAFEQHVNRWTDQLRAALGGSAGPLTPAFVKAKLCGRWPDGRLLRAGEFEPAPRSLVLTLSQGKDERERDDIGEGCPFGSHVRRMRAAPDKNGHAHVRPLQRRSIPFGPAAWSGQPASADPRGLLGHFFCASIEDQFEHLLGLWGARPPFGLAPEDNAQDPLIGAHDDANPALAVPLKGHATQRLSGFSGWTTTLGTMYAWYPGREGLSALLEDDFEPDDDEGPWL